MTIDITALARLGAERRLAAIEAEIAEICAAFPGLCGPVPQQPPLNGLTVELRTRVTRTGRTLTEKQYASMVRNAKHARRARKRKLAAVRAQQAAAGASAAVLH